MPKHAKPEPLTPFSLERGPLIPEPSGRTVAIALIVLALSPIWMPLALMLAFWAGWSRGGSR